MSVFKAWDAQFEHIYYNCDLMDHICALVTDLLHGIWLWLQKMAQRPYCGKKTPGVFLWSEESLKSSALFSLLMHSNRFCVQILSKCIFILKYLWWCTVNDSAYWWNVCIIKANWTSPLNPVGGTISFVSLTKPQSRKGQLCPCGGLKATDKDAKNQTGGSHQWSLI